MARTELIEVTGGLVQPTGETPVAWSQETLEARLAEEVAKIAYVQAQRVYVEAREKVTRQRRKAASADDHSCLAQLDDLEAHVKADLDELGRRLLAARVRMHQLELRDTEHAQHQKSQARRQRGALALSRDGI